MADRNSNGRGKQGFASMDPKRVREIAAKGGRSHGKTQSKGKND